jgi:hypothetical protein
MTEVAQVMHFGVAVVLVGATLGNGVGAVEFWISAGMGRCEDGGSDADSGTEKEVNCGGGGDGITLGIGGGTGRSSCREVCWRKILLSWSSLWCWLSEMGDRGEDGEGNSNALARS